jgi:hypothetical protein
MNIVANATIEELFTEHVIFNKKMCVVFENAWLFKPLIHLQVNPKALILPKSL